MTADWVATTMWWHVYPLGFTGAPIWTAHAEEPPSTARLARIEAWLDHLLELGLNGLALGPVFASSTHGYDTVDYFHIDPRLGTLDDFDRLVAAAKPRGIRVLLDGVFNHVGRDHLLFVAALRDGPTGEAGRMFRWSGAGDDRAPEVFEGHEALPTLNHADPAVADLVVEVMCHWLERGVDGWRLDAAYAVAPSFWAGVLPRVREQFPDAWFVGEVIHGDAVELVRASTMDSVTQYELWQGIWHGIADRNLFELAHALRRHDALLEAFVPATFVGNHDVTRIASAVGGDFAEHAFVMLMTVAGIPFVYAGDEYAQRGVKEQRWGGDDAIRPEFPVVPPTETALDESAQRMLGTYRHLVSLRRQHPWLVSARTDEVEVSNTAAVWRTAITDDAIVTALNLGDAEAVLPAAGGTRVLAGEGRIEGARLRLPARGWAILGS